MTRRFHFSLPAFLAMLATAALGVHLALWQLDRAEEKRDWLASQAQRGAIELTLDRLLALDDPAHYRVRLRGRFDNDHNVLLDNRMHQGVAGYHVLTPFLSDGHWVLVNRGWIPRGTDYAVLPDIPPVPGEVEVAGHSYIYGSRTFTLGAAAPSGEHWPLRVQAVEMEAIGARLGVELAPFEIRVAADGAPGDGNSIFVRAWQGSTTGAGYGPERHQAYALQWFLLALAAVGVYLAASWRRQP